MSKKISVLLLAAGMILTSVTGASAVDFKAKGQWVMSFDYGANGNFSEYASGGNPTARKSNSGWHRNANSFTASDNFDATQRVRLQLDAVASESLSGTVYFEIAHRWGQNWGGSSQADGSKLGGRPGGALGSDGLSVMVKNAYLDWIVPQTNLKLRMGIQSFALPNLTGAGSQIFDADVAGITASYRFNDNFSATLAWLRPYNDNVRGWTQPAPPKNFFVPAGYRDNVDIFALLLPMNFEGVRLTPWVAYGMYGANQLLNSYAQTPGHLGAFRDYFPAVFLYDSTRDTTELRGYGDILYVGFTGDVTAWDPFRLAWDFNYGSLSHTKEFNNRAGWYGTVLAEYKTDWGIPGIYAWYSSGDDDDPTNGSERLPSFNVENGYNAYSGLGSLGNPYIGRDGIVGDTLIGTWGIGVRLKDFSFMDDLKHTLRINYFGGTNSPAMAGYINGRHGANRAPFNLNPNYIVRRSSMDYNLQAFSGNSLYLTTMDSAMEFSLASTYKIYENLEMYVQMDYIALWLDSNTWKYSYSSNSSPSTRDAWNINVSFVYNF